MRSGPVVVRVGLKRDFVFLHERVGAIAVRVSRLERLK